MCVSTAPAQFTGTTLFLGKKYHPQHGWVFVLGYQNTAQNLASGPNAMLLHLPAVGMTQQNFLDTRSCRHILRDMVTSLMPQTRSHSFGGMSKGHVQVFEYDIYTVVLATDASLIPNALPLVPAHKRIAVNQPLFDFYARCYPGYAVALCCFDNQQAEEAAPLLMWYHPMNPDVFMLPALDCHTGRVPSLSDHVDVDHWVILGTDDLPRGISSSVYSTNHVPAEIDAFLPQYIIGKRFRGKMRNGDFSIHHREVERGNLAAIERIGPPKEESHV